MSSEAMLLTKIHQLPVVRTGGSVARLSDLTIYDRVGIIAPEARGWTANLGRNVEGLCVIRIILSRTCRISKLGD